MEHSVSEPTECRFLQRIWCGSNSFLMITAVTWVQVNLGKNCFLFLFWHSEQFMYTTSSELAIFMYWTCNSMNNLLSYCGLVDARITASEKDLPVSWVKNQQNLISKVIFLCQRSVLSFWLFFRSEFWIRRATCINNIFDNFNFWNSLFSKSTHTETKFKSNQTTVWPALILLDVQHCAPKKWGHTN